MGGVIIIIGRSWVLGYLIALFLLARRIRVEGILATDQDLEGLEPQSANTGQADLAKRQGAVEEFLRTVSEDTASGITLMQGVPVVVDRAAFESWLNSRVEAQVQVRKEPLTASTLRRQAFVQGRLVINTAGSLSAPGYFLATELPGTDDEVYQLAVDCFGDGQEIMQAAACAACVAKFADDLGGRYYLPRLPE